MERKTKVTHIVIFENYQEGYSYQENLLSQKHKELGYDVSIIASQSYRDNNYNYHLRPLGDYVNEYGINVYVLKNTKHNPHLSQFYDKCIGLYEKLFEIKPDIIFLHNFSGKDVSYIALYMQQFPRTKLYVDCHSDYRTKPVKTIMQKITALVRRHYAHILLPFVEKFWGTIPWRVQYLHEIYKIPEEKLGLLIMGADERNIVGKDPEKVSNEIREKYGIPKDAFLIATGGKLDKRKQQQLLMEAVKQLKNDNVWLIVFGSATEEMKPIFESYNNCNNIVQAGWIPSDKAYDIFMASQIAIFPGSHSVLWEQVVACATPIVVRYWPGHEHIDVGGNAILMDNISVDTIEKVIRNLQNKELYKGMKSRAKEVAQQFYLKGIALKAIGENQLCDNI